MKIFRPFLGFVIIALILCGVFVLNTASSEELPDTNNSCVQCHIKISPGQVADWKASKHFEEDITCSDCHGENHKNEKDVDLVVLPDESVCSDCHEEQFSQFAKGKHSHGWSSLNAISVTHLEPDELMEGGGGCGGCHNMGIKTKAQKKELKQKGFRYRNNSCDECHTRHSFSKKEALDPRACQQCHMGYDHPQWEMWSSSKHGTRWLARKDGNLPESAPAPKCQDCHLAGGNHENRTAWGFFGVKLPLPKEPQWAADRIVILKALGLLDPKKGKPTKRFKTIKNLDFIRLTQESWDLERKKMIKTCSRCHAKNFALQQLEMGDKMIRKTDRLMADAIKMVADLYTDGILTKPTNYLFAYPDFFYFMRTGGGNLEQASHIEQLLFQMYMKYRMRTYQAFFHVNPDYAYWYGWAMLTKNLTEIREKVKNMRITYKKER